MDNVAIIVADRDAAIIFFTVLGMELEGRVVGSEACGRIAPSGLTASGARLR